MRIKLVFINVLIFAALTMRAQTPFIPDKGTEKKGKKFFMDIAAGAHRSHGGDYKIPIPIFYPSSFVSMTKVRTTKYQGGGTAGYCINKNVKITLGVFYLQQGQNYAKYSSIEKDTGTGYTRVSYAVSRKVELTYLRVPLQFHYSTNESKTYSFTCYVGFYYGYLLKYRDSFKIDGSNSYGHLVWTDTAMGNTYHEYFNASMPWYYGNTDKAHSFSSRPYKSYDLGQMIGIGVQKKLSSYTSFLIMLNYQYGYVNIKNSDSEYMTGSSSRKFWNYFGTLDPNQYLSFNNSLLGISAGLRFKL
jgi:hypothetical protein